MSSQDMDFYRFNNFHPGQYRKLLLVQVDIEGHSKLSKEKRPADVMKMKVELAESLADRFKAQGFGGVGWQGDGGMFALDVTEDIELVDKTVSSWRVIRHAAEQISKRYENIVGEGQVIPIRTSAHLCEVIVHQDPRYWHAQGLNEFAKLERELGKRDSFVITGELYRELAEEAKKEFEKSPTTVLVGQREDIYEYSAGVIGDKNMALIKNEMETIVREIMSFRSAVKHELEQYNSSSINKKPILIVVDLQKDFSGNGSLAVQNSEQIAEITNTLSLKALDADVDVVLTRDWHPENHFSFNTWPRHCVVNSEGSEFIDEFKYEKLRESVHVVSIGLDNETPDYNPYFDPKFRNFMINRKPEHIYVCGIALEYCVLATCLSSLAYSNNVVALENYILSAKSDQAEIAWGLLKKQGVKRMQGIPFE